MSETVDTLRTELGAIAAGLKATAKDLDALGRALDPIDPAAVRKGLGVLEALSLPDPAALRSRVGTAVATELRRRAQELPGELRTTCEAQGIALSVVTRSPLELRLAPLGFEVDVSQNEARCSFGREALGRCEATAEAMLAERERVLAELEGKGWEAATYFGALRQAWQRLAPKGDWVELVDLLPELVLALQSDRFRRDPSLKNFRPYSRAQLAYDLHRLRRDRTLAHDGWRLTLGPATGGSTRNKKRVFWLEDAQGRGQYHLTLRFVRG